MEAKYSSECLANTLQNYPELYKMEKAKAWHTLYYYLHKNNNYYGKSQYKMLKYASRYKGEACLW